MIIGTSCSTKPCSETMIWLSTVDGAIKCKEWPPDVKTLSDDDKIRIIGYFLEEKGNRREARISGVTREDVSQMFPRVTVEVAALFYASYIYYEKWDHCYGITLVDEKGDFNTDAAIDEAYRLYKEWYEEIKRIGIKEARARGLDPLGSSNRVYWYGNSKGQPPKI